MNYKLNDSVSLAGSEARPNEDTFGFNPVAAWVLDGATGLASAPVVSEQSDARWLVEKANEALRDFGDVEDLSLSDLFHNVISYLKISFSDEAIRIPSVSHEYPSSSMIFTRYSEGLLEYASLGDCRLLLRRKSGDVVSLGGNHMLSALDQLALDKSSEHPDVDTLTVADRFKGSLPILREHRDIANSEGGYWLLGLDVEAASHISEGALHVEPGDEVLLMSDGFYRLVNVFGKISESGIFDIARDNGLEELGARLRITERSDPECIDHPRFKVSDDATALFIRIE